jgi:hypothetical protein
MPSVLAKFRFVVALISQGDCMEEDVKKDVQNDVVDVSIEDLEPIVAPGLNFNHNETLIRE